jgi:peptidoglycan hydrolase-like amidase
VYGGYGAEVASTDSAIAATAAQLRLYRNTPIIAEFSSLNGRATAAADQVRAKLGLRSSWFSFAGVRPLDIPTWR